MRSTRTAPPAPLRVVPCTLYPAPGTLHPVPCTPHRFGSHRSDKRADGRFYGNQGGGEGRERGDAVGLTSVNSAEGLTRLVFPFGQLGGRSSPAQALYDDITDLAGVRGGAAPASSVEAKLYGR